MMSFDLDDLINDMIQQNGGVQHDGVIVNPTNLTRKVSCHINFIINHCLLNEHRYVFYRFFMIMRIIDQII